MATQFEIGIVNNNPILAMAHIDVAVDEMRRVERLLTTVMDSSAISQINRNAGKRAVKVNKEFFDLIVSSFSMWNYNANMKLLNEAENQELKPVNNHNIDLDEANCTVYLKKKGMRLDLNDIDKAYAAERARVVLREQGIESGFISVAGELTAWGLQPDGDMLQQEVITENDKPEASSFIRNIAANILGSYDKLVPAGRTMYAC